MADNNNDNVIEEFMKGMRDFGTEPLDTALSEEQKRLAALSMGMNAAVVQFINEGVIPLEEQMHFMMHLQDFAARVYSGEVLKLPNTSQSLSINSMGAKLFAEAAIEAIENGHKNFEKMKELAQQVSEIRNAREDNEQTNKLGADNGKKPTLH